MKSIVILIVWFLFTFYTKTKAQFVNGRKLESLVPELCAERLIHETSPFGNNYYYSWREKVIPEDWLGSRNICRMRCMDSVALETTQENDWIKNKILNEDIKEIWTAGRKCDFKGCDREDLQPVDINGWFWTSIFKKMPPTTDRENNDWSYTGGNGVQQPDNREAAISNRQENCLALLNNVYNDGIHWHDEICNTRRQYICEDNEELLNYARYIRPDLNIK